jgi:hypothetical protein
MKLDIPSLVECEESFIDSVVAQRTVEPNKTYFTDYKNTWKARVNEYTENSGNPEVISDSTEVSNSNKFINLYGTSDDNMHQKAIIDSLRDRELQLCPSCGENGTPNTLDHYLPKNKYPEYAILSKNLFPMCDICQGKKLAFVLDQDERRIFLHPYYDDFLTEQVIELQIDGPFNAPENFNLNVVNSISEELQELILRHLSGIGFQSRYSTYFKNQYFRLLRIVKVMRSSGQDVSAQIDSFALMERFNSVNSWGHIFYSGVISNRDLMDFLINGQIPKTI